MRLIMKRLMFRRRPEFESLESMLLLSGVAAAGHPYHAAAAMVASHRPVRDAVVSLSGTASGTYRAGRATGLFTFTGKGTVSPPGHATVKGSFLMPNGQITISTRHGKVFANLS